MVQLKLKNKMKNQQGFTLIETLFVFSVFLIIVTTSVLLLKPQYHMLEKERFFSQFKADMLFSQQYAIANQTIVTVYLKMEDQHYVIKDRKTNQTLIKREIPASITLETGTLPSIFDFDSSGKISRFGTLYFDAGEERYKITFQIGMGRFYVGKEK